MKTQFMRFHYQGERTELVFRPSRVKFWHSSVLVGPRNAPGTEELLKVIDGMIKDATERDENRWHRTHDGRWV